MGFSFARAIAIAVLVAGPVWAEERYPSEMDSDYGQEDSASSDLRSGAGPFSLRGGLGFTSDPTSFLFGVEADYEVAPQFSLGGNVQVGLDDDVTIVSPTAFARYRIDMGAMDSSLAAIEPSLGLGVGFTWWDRDLAFGRDDDDVAFLVDIRPGVEYRFTPNFAIGTLFHFNIIPTGLFDDRDYEEQFYFAWEVLTFRVTF
jgi:hypothetical protein